MHAFSPALVRGLGVNPSPPEGIVLTGARQCKRWLRVITQGHGPYVTIDGVSLNYGPVFNYYMTQIGVSPYFTYGGYLFKFVYTGYDAKTGKYTSGGKNEILICVDGLFVESTGHGGHYVSKTSKLGSGAAIGGVMGLPSGVGKIQPLAPGESPVIPVPSSAPSFVVNTTLQSGLPGTYSPTYPSAPGTTPTARSSASAQAILATMAAAGQPQPAQYYAPSVAPAGMSTTAMVIAGLLGIAVLGGVIYLVSEASSPASSST